MAKLVKNYYYTSKGEKKVNNYQIAVAKSIAKQAGFTGEEKIKIYAKNGKIIIEKMED